jgi:hypothetical protein
VVLKQQLLSGATTDNTGLVAIVDDAANDKQRFCDGTILAADIAADAVTT